MDDTHTHTHTHTHMNTHMNTHINTNLVPHLPDDAVATEMAQRRNREVDKGSDACRTRGRQATVIERADEG